MKCCAKRRLIFGRKTLLLQGPGNEKVDNPVAKLRKKYVVQPEPQFWWSLIPKNNGKQNVCPSVNYASD